MVSGSNLLLSCCVNVLSIVSCSAQVMPFLSRKRLAAPRDLKIFLNSFCFFLFGGGGVVFWDMLCKLYRVIGPCRLHEDAEAKAYYVPLDCFQHKYLCETLAHLWRLEPSC